jgi:hypothetical protein
MCTALLAAVALIMALADPPNRGNRMSPTQANSIPKRGLGRPDLHLGPLQDLGMGVDYPTAWLA